MGQPGTIHSIPWLTQLCQEDWVIPEHLGTSCGSTGHFCRPDRTRQVAGQGGAATHTHTHAGPTLPARPHSAGRRSGRSRNTHTHMRDQPCRPDRTRQVAGQGGAATHMHVANPADETTLKVRI